MANFTITVSNALNTFGPRPNYWGAMVWGDQWGEGLDLPVATEKLLQAQSLSLDSANSFDATRFLNTQTLAPTFAIASLSVKDSHGFSYSYATPPTFTSGLSSTTGWVSVAAASPTWS